MNFFLRPKNASITLKTNSFDIIMNFYCFTPPEGPVWLSNDRQDPFGEQSVIRPQDRWSVIQLRWKIDPDPPMGFGKMSDYWCPWPHRSISLIWFSFLFFTKINLWFTFVSLYLIIYRYTEKHWQYFMIDTTLDTLKVGFEHSLLKIYYVIFNENTSFYFSKEV
jgi:hypothetical protein